MSLIVIVGLLLTFLTGIPVARQISRNHPRGLFILFFAELWERFSFYGMRTLLILYLTQHFLFDDAFASHTFGAFTTLAYMLPLVGGVVADFERTKKMLAEFVQKARSGISHVSREAVMSVISEVTHVEQRALLSAAEDAKIDRVYMMEEGLAAAFGAGVDPEDKRASAIVDIGGESTRPGSEGVSLDEELRRVLPVLEALAGAAPVSIDTAKAGKP